MFGTQKHRLSIVHWRSGAWVLALALLLWGPMLAAEESGAADFRLPPQLSLQLSEQWDARLDGRSRFGQLPSFGDSYLLAEGRPAAAFLDWRPLEGGFRISGGYYAGASTQDPASVGTAGYDYMRLNSYGSPLSLGGNSSVSYLGIGWDGDADPAGGWGFNLDLGMLFTETDGVEGSAGTADAIDPGFQSTREFGSYKDLDGAAQYPVLSIGARYRW